MAASSRTPANRLGLLAAGLLLGVILALVAVRLYVREAERARVEAAIRERIRLPEDAFRVEEINPDRSIRASLRRVAVLDRAGDTIVAAPRVNFVFDPSSLAGEGPLVFRDVDVLRPTLRLVQGRDEEWNLAQAFALEADGTPVQGAEEVGRGIVLRGMRITGGKVLLATPWTPEDSLLAGASPRIVRLAGTRMLVRTARDLEARVPFVRFGGERGWRVEVADATALLAEPEVGRVALRGWAEEDGDGFRFGLDRLRTGQSFVSGQGRIGLGGETLAYDLTLRAAPLSFRDLQWIRPTLPSEGTARFLLDVETRAGGRTAYDFRELDVRLLDSHVFGRMAVLTREGAAPTFYDTRLTLDPLLLSDLETLGFVDEIPYTGRITGTLASVEAIQGTEGTLRVDLAASLTPEGVPGAAPASVAAHGLVDFGEEGVRLRGVRVEADPLPLMAFAPFVENRENLRGVVRGSALLSGTPSDLRIESGLLAYEVGDAPVSRIRIAEGRITTEPELRYRLDLRAEPLALATLTELYPSLPFRAATLTGPISLVGTPESLRFDADLHGAAGGIAASGTVAFGEVLRFDVSGRVEAFRTGAVLTSGGPLEGPLTGTFSARGTAADFRFAVDLAQGAGSFALQGRVRGGAEARQFDVSGTVSNFRLGTLIGRPGFLPSPVSGRIALTGGGRQPYRFDVDVRGGVGVLDLEGSYAPGAVPVYSVSGTVAGLNLEGLPQAGVLPATNLTGTLALRGQGTTLETLTGELRFRVTGPSTIGGLPLETGVVDVAVRNGVLVVDKLLLALGGARLAAEGSIGLTRPAGEGLRFSFVAQDLGTLAAVIPPEGPLEPSMAGSLQMTGTVTGALRSPEVAASLRGDGLRFNEWRAGVLAGLCASRRGEEWVGEGSLQGGRLVFAGGESLQSLRLEANVTPAAASFGVFARRNPESEIAASGTLERAEGSIQGALLQSFNVRVGTITWQLQQPSRIRWGGVDGVAVEQLILRRTGTATGMIEVDGRLPPTGRADLRVRAAGVDLAELRRIAGRGPEVAGILSLDATIEGPVSEPEMLLRASVDSLRYAGAAANRVALDARYAGRRLVGTAGAWLGGGQVLDASYTVPMLLSFGGTIPVPSVEILENGALTARVVADSVPLGLLTASVPGVSGGRGAVGARVDVAGTPADPRVQGWARVVNGTLNVDTLGTRWDSINGRVTLEGQRIRIDSLVAKSVGWARVEGTVRLASLTAPEFRLTTTLNEFQVIDKRDVAELLVTARVALSGRLTEPVVSGLIILDEGTIYIPQLDEQRTELEIVETEIGALGADTIPASVTASTTSVLGGLIADNLDVRVENDVWLQSRDARVQIAGELNVQRTAGGVPEIYGNLQALRGFYTLEIGPFQREFEIERGLVEFFGTEELNPALDIRAVHEVRSPTGEGGRSSLLRIIVQITGTLRQPRLALTSDTRPPLPEEELFNYLVFGRPSFALGGGTGALAQQVFLEGFLAGYVAGEIERTLAGTGVVDFVRVRTGPTGTFAGLGTLNPLEVGGALGLAAATVEVGKEIAEGFFLTAEFGVGSLLGNDLLLGVGAEWQIDPHWTVRAGWEVPRVPSRFRFYQDIYEDVERQLSTDVFWRREFGFPRNDSALGPPPGIGLPGEVAPPREAPRDEQPRRRERRRRETPRNEEW